MDAGPAIHTIFMLVKTTRSWLALAPPERFRFLDEHVTPILRAHEAVAMRYYDAEFYPSRFSDVIVWETADLGVYRELIEALRETPFWDEYFDVAEIIPAVENAYAKHYRVPTIA